MIIIKNNDEVELMRKSALLVSKTLSVIAAEIKPGVTTLSLDNMIGEFIRDHHAIPSFLNYNGYPFNSCISVNDVVVHGFPNKRELRAGDIISVDIGVI
jgi:methionyl aminopeptidase